MTRQDIIDLADKAIEDMPPMRYEIPEEFCEKFAKLIAQLAKAEEREACARVCETLRHQDYVKETYEWISATNNCADAIRERGQS